MYVLFRFRLGFSTVKRTIFCSRMNEIANVFVMFFPNTCPTYVSQIGICHIHVPYMCLIQYICQIHVTYTCFTFMSHIGFVTYMSHLGVPCNVFDKHMSHTRVPYRFLSHTCPIQVSYIMYLPNTCFTYVSHIFICHRHVPQSCYI